MKNHEMRIVEQKTPSQLWGELRLTATQILGRGHCMTVLRVDAEQARRVLDSHHLEDVPAECGLLMGSVPYPRFVSMLLSVWPNMPLATFGTVVGDAAACDAVPVLWIGVRPVGAGQALECNTDATLGILQTLPAAASN